MGCGRPDGVRAHRCEGSGIAGLRRWELGAPCYLPYQSVLRIGGRRTRLDARAAHVSDSLIRLSDGKTQGPSCVTILGSCLQTSQRLPMRNYPGICSLSLFRCPGKIFVSVFSSTLFPMLSS